MKPHLRIIYGALLLASLLCAGTLRASCKNGDPTGYFEGTATSGQAGKLDVSLNLRCVDGHYDGELVSPVGSYSVDEGDFQAGSLHLHFVNGADSVVFDGKLDAGVLRGTFHSGEDSGPFEIKRIGDAKNPVSSNSAHKLTPEQWHEDLKFFATELPKKHGNAFHYATQERFNAEIAKLDAQIDHLNSDEIYVGMDRIANLIGDGHTYVSFPDDTANFPIAVRRFGNDYRIIAVTPGNEKALGARIVRIADVPIERAKEMLLTLTPADENANLGLARIEDFMTMGICLHGLGITSDRNVVHYTLADDAGKEFAFESRAMSMSQFMETKMIFVFKKPALYQQKPDETFWYVYLPESKIVYCNFRGYKDLGNYASGLRKLIKQHHPEKLVIDLRQNGGGDYTEGLKHVIQPIRDMLGINKKGHLFVLIGPYTFSAGMSNAAQFHSETNAILVGEPIGEKPNSYQESREMRLPNSQWVVRYSTKFYKFVSGTENVVKPDKEIDRSWPEYKAGRDPVLEWVLKYPAN